VAWDSVSSVPILLPQLVRIASINSREQSGSTLTEAARLLSSSLAIREQSSLGYVTLMRYRGLPSEHTIVYRDGIRITNEQNSLTDFGWLDAAGIYSISLVPSVTA